MSDKPDKLNGSVDLLAQAMRKVFSEAVQEAVQPVRKDMEGMETRLNKNMDRMEERLNDRIDTTNENVHAQLAQTRKDISDDVKAALTEKE